MRAVQRYRTTHDMQQPWKPVVLMQSWPITMLAKTAGILCYIPPSPSTVRHSPILPNSKPNEADVIGHFGSQQTNIWPNHVITTRTRIEPGGDLHRSPTTPFALRADHLHCSICGVTQRLRFSYPVLDHRDLLPAHDRVAGIAANSSAG
jgi:hypothetical protein